MKKWKKVLLYVLTVLLVMAGVCGYFLFLYRMSRTLWKATTKYSRIS